MLHTSFLNLSESYAFLSTGNQAESFGASCEISEMKINSISISRRLMWHLQHKQSLLLGRKIKSCTTWKGTMFKVLVEMSGWTRWLQKGVGRGKLAAKKGTDWKSTCLCCHLSQWPWGQRKHLCNNDERKRSKKKKNPGDRSGTLRGEPWSQIGNELEELLNSLNNNDETKSFIAGFESQLGLV